MTSPRSTKPSVVILGAGDIGSAVCHLLKKTARVECWDKLPGKVPHQKSLETILPTADVVFLCLQSWVTRAALKECHMYLRPPTVVVSLAKGLEAKTHMTVDAVLRDVLPTRQPTALLLGPMLAEEIRSGLKASAIVASTNREAVRHIVALFQSTDLQIRTSTDVRGAAYASVLKNIYALSLGIVDGLHWGSNRKGWIAAHAIKEMETLIAILDGARETIFSDPGVPDFIATGFSTYSKNRHVGEALASGKPLTFKSEGLVSLPSLLSILGKNRRHFLLLQAVASVILKRKNAKTTFETLYQNV